jgi:hypothetical protein
VVRAAIAFSKQETVSGIIHSGAIFMPLRLIAQGHRYETRRVHLLARWGGVIEPAHQRQA